MNTVTVTLEEMEARRKARRDEVLNTSDRCKSAFVLANMALEQDGGGAEAAASLLLSMEYSELFNFENLLRLDAENRAHADIVMAGYHSCDFRPSSWLEEIGEDGKGIFSEIRQIWSKK